MRVFLFIALFLTQAFADEIKIDVTPEYPLVGESFEVKFTIQTDADDEPIINFDPFNVDVIDRSDVSTSTRIMYVNGKSSVEKKMSVTYELSAPRVGGAFLRNIKVNIGDKEIKHPTVRLNVVKTPKQAKKVFVRAELDKESVFVGESFVVRYYLYHLNTVNLSSFDIKKFPKLDKFLKRFHQENLAPERVNFNGKNYVRRIMYTAQLFSEKEGKFKVDPLMLKVRYGDRAQNPLSNFGFNFSTGRTRSTTVSSKVVEVEVMSLPADGMPPHFTGLVGKHKFSLSNNKNKFIANEPIELQLTISGEGAMELFEAPTLLTDPNLEEFEKTSDFQINRDFTSQKKVNYTYLGRGNVNLTNKTIPFAYFNPETRTYITENLTIGDILVAGASTTPGTTIQDSDTKTEVNCDPTSNLTTPNVNLDEFLNFKPLFRPLNTFIYFTEELFWIFSLSILLLLGYITFSFIKSKGRKELTLMESIFQNGISYQSLHRLLSQGDGVSMERTILKLTLSDACQKYFLSLVDLMNKFFTAEGSEHKVAVNKKYFKELEKALKNYEQDNQDY